MSSSSPAMLLSLREKDSVSLLSMTSSGACGSPLSLPSGAPSFSPCGTRLALAASDGRLLLYALPPLPLSGAGVAPALDLAAPIELAGTDGGETVGV